MKIAMTVNEGMVNRNLFSIIYKWVHTLFKEREQALKPFYYLSLLNYLIQWQVTKTKYLIPGLIQSYKKVKVSNLRHQVTEFLTDSEF